MRFFTKSRFKEALECPTKLYYSKNKDYANSSSNDTFLQSLAEGGFQVGEIAKFYFHDNPIEENITVDTYDQQEAVNITNQMLSNHGRIVIAEAAFEFKNFFVRVDILVKDGDNISIYEVKAKSWDVNNDILTNHKNNMINSKWRPYVYDIAFQKYVVSNALQSDNIKAYLTLVDKSKVATINGLNQFFTINKDSKHSSVIVKEGLKRKDLGDDKLLIDINVDDECWNIHQKYDVPTDLGSGISFTEFIQNCSDIYKNKIRIFSKIGPKCNDCQYRILEKSNLKSGFNECWMESTKLTENQLNNESLVSDLWAGSSGSRSYQSEMINKGIYLLKDVTSLDVAPKSFKTKTKRGLTPFERRMEQINRLKNGITDSYIDKDGLKEEIDNFIYPVHMIDFETSSVALPFFKGMKPYETIAFQFSHHTISENWNVEHKSQYLCFEKNKFPNFEFVRNLKEALGDIGTIFRYHNHENTTLNKIREQLLISDEIDKIELIEFIDFITHKKGRGVGSRDMKDLYKLVVDYYYSPLTNGSNSIKSILPAIISESKFLKDKYGQLGVYGIGLEVGSLNFTDHQWIKEGYLDPYKSLPPVFPELRRDDIDSIKGLEELNDGGAALTAYNYLQYTNISDEQREYLRSALYKYCELDTMAMVMIMEAWRDMINK